MFKPIETEPSNTNEKIRFKDGSREVSFELSQLSSGERQQLINRAMTFIGSDESEENPDPINDAEEIHQGIKMENGIPLYQTFLWCKKEGCHNREQHYIAHNKKVYCSKCKTPHLKRKANPAGGNLSRDRFGNYFRADRLVEDSEAKQEKSMTNTSVTNTSEDERESDTTKKLPLQKTTDNHLSSVGEALKKAQQDKEEVAPWTDHQARVKTTCSECNKEINIYWKQGQSKKKYCFDCKQSREVSA
ncbi:hypothetical protein [Salibacterium halotolerans]|uniref:Uncharacterized protein n=1 Tax=Salibacterium halotolerans TaxID=1884432 RepID=A0A1I5MKU6_9BACI|nr:hypothetical protein [Salibacterium halotolerans]SFP09937.1 hypothetical protein SAMN05518683_102264 [Salibacterium halotolerans]